MPEGVCEWDNDMQLGESLRMGEVIGQLSYPDK